MDFTFSDTIAGYVTRFDADDRTFELATTDDRRFTVRLTDATYAEVMRNLDEPFTAPDGGIEQALGVGRYLFAHGIFYPDGDYEAKRIVLVGQGVGEFRFEEPDWWIKQVDALGKFYLRAQFPDGVIDYRGYRTHLTVEGQKVPGTRQETDTISRLIYGFATAFLLTGNDRYLEAAERGTEYLRDHMRAVDEQEGVVYWYHGIDVREGRERKILASQFGDDYDAIPAYEQIYALAGPVQTLRITGDPRILRDAEMTINLFDRFFLDRDKGGYFSHVDPVTFDPRSPSLTVDRARKNWNSIGDHAPAYLINLWLATGADRYAQFLSSVGDIITERFPDYDNSPFVQERFHEDWSPDRGWGWQQDRAVVGHNLKIAWNLMRIHQLRPNEAYPELASKIAKLMPQVGMDRQRGGWYDVVERTLAPGQSFHRLVWHDRKAWWQQEQAILAYLILNGTLGGADFQKYARESISFYNAWFPDHDSGAVYFNVLADGLPYLLGTERLKGSHSMSGYHSFELCYLAATYTNLLVRKQPMDLYFKPQPNGFPDGVLRVAPDLLPPGSVRLQAVWIDGERWTDFDADALAVNLPKNRESDIKVRVCLVPSTVGHGLRLDLDPGAAVLVLDGDLDDEAEEALRNHLSRVVAARPKQLVLRAEALASITRTNARALVFACQSLTLDTDIYLVGVPDDARAVFGDVGFLEQATVVDDASAIEPIAEPEVTR
ncbi:AGE family epimerase/isomerase [Actinoplanes subtropicus]|uniref:AGE family epimerase/isomerase n=1 Tax=Actinoplanes subtropicus TaxID=543632 RepID=UPI0007C541D6|nr:AGE family epimerase/isomerase [Actinoplanes subtropicus]